MTYATCLFMTLALVNERAAGGAHFPHNCTGGVYVVKIGASQNKLEYDTTHIAAVGGLFIILLQHCTDDR